MAGGLKRPSTALYKGVKALITCDSGEVVSGIVGFVVSQHRSLRLLSRAIARAEGSTFGIALIVLNAVRCYAFLINTCRGPVVDECALEGALLDGSLAGAALDVFETEPLPVRSRLRSLPNCWLAPHNANSSVAAAERVHERTIRALLEVLSASQDRRVTSATF